jgi:sulfur-oxidizing protein SoxZ
MASTIKIRSRRLADFTEIKILVRHPMENGRNRDRLTGELIPAHFIRQLELTLNGKLMVSADLGGSLSKDPFFSFRLKHSEPGDRLTATWRDNLDASDSAVHIID